MLTFLAFDIELANPDLSSVCQVAIATFDNGRLTNVWETLVNPLDYFDPLFVAMHGIQEASVAHSPTVAMLSIELQSRLRDRIVVTHTAFNRVAVCRALERCSRPAPSCRWLDSARVARRTWQGLACGGFGLEEVAARLGIHFRSNQAGEDARATGEILLKAIEVSGLGLGEWFVRVEQPVAAASIAQAGSPDGPLYGHTIVFTGALSLTRAEAANLAAKAGCTVTKSVNKGTTLLVVGQQDIQRLVGHTKSSKHRRAEELIGEGQRIRILSEADFRRTLAKGAV